MTNRITLNLTTEKKKYSLLYTRGLCFYISPGVDPDDTYNETPYEKGFCFVSYLAHLTGDQARFDAFLKVL